MWKIGFNADPDSAVRVGETFRVNFTNPGNLHLYRNSAKYLRIKKTWLSISIKMFEFHIKGQAIAAEFNFPDELISLGRYSKWSTSEHLHNLNQLSKMDLEDFEGSPNQLTSTPHLSSGYKGKGIGKRRKLLS